MERRRAEREMNSRVSMWDFDHHTLHFRPLKVVLEWRRMEAMVKSNENEGS